MELEWSSSGLVSASKRWGEFKVAPLATVFGEWKESLNILHAAGFEALEGEGCDPLARLGTIFPIDWWDDQEVLCIDRDGEVLGFDWPNARFGLVERGFRQYFMRRARRCFLDIGGCWSLWAGAESHGQHWWNTYHHPQEALIPLTDWPFGPEPEEI